MDNSNREPFHPVEASAGTSSETVTAATGTLRYRLMPKSSKPAAIPANSAHVVPDIGDHECRQHGAADPDAVALPQTDEALLVTTPSGRQGRGRSPTPIVEQQNPQQLVAVVGAQHRVGGDAGRVVVGESGEQPRAQHGEQCGEPGADRVVRDVTGVASSGGCAPTRNAGRATV